MNTAKLPGKNIFEKRSVMKSTAAKMLAFHESPGALAALTPPPVFVRINNDQRTAFDQGDIKFTLWLGPLPVRWWARHEPGPQPYSFVDVMVEGPMASWRHEHLFTDVPGGVELHDRITYTHPAGIKGLFTRLFFGGLALRFLFFYRHLRTRMALSE